MNRQFRRMAQRQGEIDEEGAPVATRRQQAQIPKGERSTPGQFVKEVRGELRRVHWPSRGEVVNYSIVTLVVIVLLTAFIAGQDFGFAESILWLFGE